LENKEAHTNIANSNNNFFSISVPFI